MSPSRHVLSSCLLPPASYLHLVIVSDNDNFRHSRDLSRDKELLVLPRTDQLDLEDILILLTTSCFLSSVLDSPCDSAQSCGLVKRNCKYHPAWHHSQYPPVKPARVLINKPVWPLRLCQLRVGRRQPELDPNKSNCLLDWTGPASPGLGGQSSSVTSFSFSF